MKCDCGCCDPVAYTPEEMLRFLSNRMKYAGVADCVAEKYARDIDLILDEFYPMTIKSIEEEISRLNRLLIETKLREYSN